MVLMAEKFRIVGSGKWAVESASNTGPKNMLSAIAHVKNRFIVFVFLIPGSIA